MFSSWDSVNLSVYSSMNFASANLYVFVLAPFVIIELKRARRSASSIGSMLVQNVKNMS